MSGGKGWGERPHLYALTEPTSPEPRTVSALTRCSGARPDALVPVEQERLPDGDLVDGPRGIHWPADVVGCVLVTELVDPAAEKRGRSRPSTRSRRGNGRALGRTDVPARLVVGVRRSGEHMCGLRIKGEDDVQVRNEMAVTS